MKNKICLFEASLLRKSTGKSKIKNKIFSFEATFLRKSTWKSKMKNKIYSFEASLSRKTTLNIQSMCVFNYDLDGLFDKLSQFISIIPI